MKATRKLRELLKAPEVIQAGGVGDAAQALLVESVGYPAVYMSGSYVNYSYGLPDGTLTMSEIAARLGEIADRVQVPVIADADEGFGGVLSVMRTVHKFERAGAAALHMEDMTVKKHGHPMPIPEMIKRLKAAFEARADPDFVIIARTDAMAPWREGVETNRAACEKDAFERSVAYAEAGADVIMPMYASMDWVKRFGKQIPKPLMPVCGVNASHRQPDGFSGGELASEFSAKELGQYNVKIVLYPTNMLSRTFGFMKKEYSEWLAAGKCVSTEQDQKNRWGANVLVGVPEKYKILAKYGE